MDLGYCSLQVGWKWQWPLGPSAREEQRVVWDVQQSGEVRRSGKIVEGAMTKISLSFIINKLQMKTQILKAEIRCSVNPVKHICS